ncbi:MAG: hypothetical protein QF415_14515 [Candidatus Undinarchaeales archaeon]|jgi:hypothetical protein|nr:hypothetical protein [Candidatus Undinarchaeales archaeon]MDP7492359.1 hypothetical protein [Candidatus Undinarchaeales archaeon]
MDPTAALFFLVAIYAALEGRGMVSPVVRTVMIVLLLTAIVAVIRSPDR